MNTKAPVKACKTCKTQADKKELDRFTHIFLSAQLATAGQQLDCQLQNGMTWRGCDGLSESVQQNVDQLAPDTQPTAIKQPAICLLGMQASNMMAWAQEMGLSLPKQRMY